MKLIFKVIILSSTFLHFISLQAQENIFTHWGLEHNLIPVQILELDDYFYVAKLTNSVDSPQKRYGILSINKYDKYSYDLIDSQYVDGDTIGIDTFIANTYNHKGIYTDGDEIYYIYEVYDSSLILSGNRKFRFTRLDKNLNFLVQPIDLPFEGGFQSLAINSNDNTLITTMRQWRDTSDTHIYMGNYHLMDKNGIILHSDSGKYFSNFLQTVNYNGDSFIVTGNQMFYFPFSSSFGWYVLDENAQRIDSANFKMDDSAKFYGDQSINLPVLAYDNDQENLIFTGFPIWGDAGDIESVFMKSNADSIHIAKHKTVNYKVDSLDNNHSNFAMHENCVYNPFDNKYYFVDISHRGETYNFMMSNCSGLDFGYVEVICFDADLNISWSKLFKKVYNDGCQRLSGVYVPDNRNGILISGVSYKEINNPDSTEYWLHYVTETTTGIHQQEITENKDFVLFPNPANNSINIEAKESIVDIKIYDITGKIVVNKQNIQSTNTSLPLDKLANGIYLIKAQFKNQSVVKKFVKGNE